MSDLSAAEEKYSRIIAVVAAIPAGSVLSYGEVARRAGLPRAARLVAKALSASADQDLPWHRVLRSDGRIAFAANSASFREQRDRLRAEGVVLKAGRVARSRPAESLDALLWSAPGASSD